MDNKLALIVQFTGTGNLTDSLRNIMGLGRSGKQALAGLHGEARKLKRDMAEAGRAIASGSGNVTTLINRERELAAQLARTNAALQRQQRLVRIDSRAEALRTRGANLQSRGQANIVGGATLAAPFIAAVASGADFSTLLVDIQQKANLSNREMASLSRSILTIARDTRQLPMDVGRSVDVLAGMGLDPRRAILMARAINRVGTAMRADVADVSAASFANLSNLNVAIGDTSRALDIMAASGNMGAFELRDMARNFPALTGQMQALGEHGLTAVGNLSAALQIARRTTGDSDTAANNVVNLLAKINSPATVRAFERNFGVDLPRAMARLRREGHDTFESIAMITNSATRGDLSRLGYAFEDMQAQAAIRSLIQNLGDYRRVRDAAMAGGGTIDRAFDQRVLHDANVSWTAFKGSVSTLAITMSTTLLPALTEVANALNGGLQWISRWAQAHPVMAGAIMKTIGVLAALRIGFGVLQFAVGALFGPLATLYRLFARLGGMRLLSRALGMLVNAAIRAAPLLVRAFGIMRVAALFLARGFMRAGLMMLANPIVLAITLIVLAIGGAAYLIYRNWDRIKTAFRNGISRIAALIPSFRLIGGNIIAGLVGGIIGAGPRIWSALRGAVMGGVNRLKSMLGIASPSRLFMQFGGFLTQGLALGIDAGGPRAIASMRGLAGDVGHAFRPAASPFGGGTGTPRQGSSARRAANDVTNHYSITVNAAPGQSARSVADEVLRLLEAAQARKARGSYGDR